MNRPILRLYGLVVVLFALLVAFTSRWTVFEASSLRENPLNQRSLLEQERVQRGAILAADGTVLARSVRTREGTYERTYPTGRRVRPGDRLLLPAERSTRTGLERYRNAAAQQARARATCSRSSTSSRGAREGRGSVVTTLDPAAQQAALAALGAHEGAVVALDPSTGAVRVMASTPSYDPNALRSPAAAARLESRQ